jgi:hypothetical protein
MAAVHPAALATGALQKEEEEDHVFPSAVLIIHSYTMCIVVSYLLCLIYIILVTVLVFISSMYTLQWPLCMFLIIAIYQYNMTNKMHYLLSVYFD